MRPSASTRQLSVPTWGSWAARYGWGSPRWSKITRFALNRRRVVVRVMPLLCPGFEASEAGSARIAVTRVRELSVGAESAGGPEGGASLPPGAAAGAQAAV